MSIRSQNRALEMMDLLEKFKQDIWPWMCENNLSVFDALAITQENFPERFAILNKLWSNYAGRNYIYDFVRMNGGRISW